MKASTVINKIASGKFSSPLSYTINKTIRNKPYWQAVGIYLKAPIFVRSVLLPQTKREKRLSLKQESRRKEVERAFGMLKSNWYIVAHPARSTSVKKKKFIMKTRIIFHNVMCEQREKKNKELDESYGMSEEATEGTASVTSTSPYGPLCRGKNPLHMHH